MTGVVIIGGGVSGLATAWFLSQLGVRSTLVEKSNRLGGLIKTDSFAECQLEAGPDSYLAAKTATTELARDLGDLGNEIIGSNDAERRVFIVRQGKLIALPKGIVMVAPSDWKAALSSPLFSAKTRLRFLTETFAAPRHRSRDLSIAELVRDHFGEEVLEYVAEPLLSGVYGGDSASLSAESVLPRFVAYERQYGSLIRGVRNERRASQGSIFLSFRRGMQSLTDALAQAIAASTNVLYAEALRITAKTNGWRIRLSTHEFDADHVVLACPAYVAAGLLRTTAPPLASELAAIPYSSAVLATLIYDRAALGHALNGFGFLVPRRERRTIAAATWVGTKFPSRVPSHLAALRGFIVEPEATSLLTAPPQEIAQLVHRDFERFMQIRSAPLSSSIYFWPRSMPQYLVGHAQRWLRIAAAARELQRLHLVGNAYQGVGISDCVRLAKETAKQIAGAPHSQTPPYSSPNR